MNQSQRRGNFGQRNNRTRSNPYPTYGGCLHYRGNFTNNFQNQSQPTPNYQLSLNYNQGTYCPQQQRYGHRYNSNNWQPGRGHGGRGYARYNNNQRY